MSRRPGKLTTAGYIFLAAFIVIVVGIALGATIGGGTGTTIDIVGAILLVILIFLLFGANTTPRGPGDDPRDHFPEPPGPGGLH